MKRLLSFKKMSVKITFVIAATVIIVAGAASFYMQTRIIDEIDNHGRLYVRYRLLEVAEKCDVAIAENAGINSLESIVSQVVLYDSGFAVLVDDRGSFFEFNNVIRNLSQTEKNHILSLASENQDKAFDIRLGSTDFISTQIRLNNNYSLIAMAPRGEVMAEVNASVTRFVIIFITVVLLVIIISYFIGKSISKPISIVADTIDKLVAGSLDVSGLGSVTEKADETGRLARAVEKLQLRLSHLTEELKIIADGDLSGEIAIEFEGDEIGGSLSRTLETFSDMFNKINASTDTVSQAAKQIADNAQTLSEGASSQSSSITELSAAFAIITEKTKENSELASKASLITDNIKTKAVTGNQQMNDMISIVDEINEASQNINKVIKVIDDIAFQTNILALNAAVEAARAGQHGKGFAVVAEEVRNLAGKSAEAAKNTAKLIKTSVEKAKLGVRIAHETGDNFTEIVSGISESGDMVSSISESTKGQADEIAHVNTAVEHLVDVIHQNSSIAEESAASSEEMSGQTDMLVELVSHFKLKDNFESYKSLPPADSPLGLNPAKRH